MTYTKLAPEDAKVIINLLLKYGFSPQDLTDFLNSSTEGNYYFQGDINGGVITRAGIGTIWQGVIL